MATRAFRFASNFQRRRWLAYQRPARSTWRQPAWHATFFAARLCLARAPAARARRANKTRVAKRLPRRARDAARRLSLRAAPQQRPHWRQHLFCGWFSLSQRRHGHISPAPRAARNLLLSTPTSSRMSRGVAARVSVGSSATFPAKADGVWWRLSPSDNILCSNGIAYLGSRRRAKQQRNNLPGLMIGDRQRTYRRIEGFRCLTRKQTAYARALVWRNWRANGALSLACMRITWDASWYA